MCGCPAACRAFGEKLFAVWTVLTLSDPRGDIVRVVASVTFVIKGKLFYGTVAGVEVIKFVIKLPFAVTPSTRDGRNAGVVSSERVVSHGFSLRPRYLINVLTVGHNGAAWRAVV